MSQFDLNTHIAEDSVIKNQNVDNQNNRSIMKEYKINDVPPKVQGPLQTNRLR